MSQEARRKISAAHRGRKFSVDHRNKIATAKIGAKNPSWKGGIPERTCRCGKTFKSYTGLSCSISCGLSERPKSPQTRRKISTSQRGVPKLNCRGERHGRWRGGITGWQNAIRTSLEYKLFHRAVLKRDNYKCQTDGCAYRGRELHVDHIKPFASFPELRFDIENGRTLCPPCHRKTPTYGRVAVQLIA